MSTSSQPRQQRTRIKICGIRDADMAMAAVGAGADAIGFVLVKGSPRQISLKDASLIAAQLPAFVTPVALLVDPTAAQIAEVCGASRRFAIQLHGHETCDFVWEFEDDCHIIKAINFGDARQMSWITDPEFVPVHVRALLIDAPAKPQATLTGGGGEAFDWTALASLDRAALPPLILAGGLTAENVGQAIATVRPYAVDVSSGVESSRGVKDLEKIRAFCAAVHDADARRR